MKKQMSVSRLTMRNMDRKSVKPEFRELSHQVARHRATSIKYPVMASVTTGALMGNYNVDIEGNTQF